MFVLVVSSVDGELMDRPSVLIYGDYYYLLVGCTQCREYVLADHILLMERGCNDVIN